MDSASTPMRQPGPLSTRRARIVGEVTYTPGNETSTLIPLGECTITVENNVATVQWGASADSSASFASAEIDQYENLGAIVYLD